MAGSVAVAGIVNGALETPLVCTITCTGPVAIPAGTSALIWVGLTYRSAAGVPLNVTDAPLAVVGSRFVPEYLSSCGVPTERAVPEIATQVPGAMPEVQFHTS